MGFRHPAPNPSGATFVLLSGEPDAAALADALRDDFTEVEVVTTAADGATIDSPHVSGRLGVDTVLVAPIAEPVLDDEALTACHPVWWDDPTPVAGHAAHAILVVRTDADDPEEDPRAHALRQTMTASVAAAALAANPDVVGIFSRAAGATFPPQAYAEFLATARAEQELPVELWATTWLEPHDDGTVSGWTHGLETFGHADLVVEDSVHDPSAVYHLLASLAEHIVATGERLEPGHELGWADGVHQVGVPAESTDAHPLLAIDF